MVLTFVLLHNIGLCQQNQISITFELHSPDLPDDTFVYITGSVPELGNWNPGRIQMKSLGDHKWSYQIQSKTGLPIDYKYTLGSWARENANADGNPLRNFAIHPKSDQTVQDRVLFWTSGKERKIRGQITGTVRYHKQMEYEGLLPRDVIIWLPPGYKGSTNRYPVLYMHDGQNIVDPKTSAFGVDWQIDETLTKLIESGKCPPIIVIGIYNTAERGKDYMPGEQGDRYVEFICRKLKPFIDENYRTDPALEATAIAGSSAGGICAFRMAWENPDVFSKAICMSPAFEYKKSDGSYRVDYVEQFAKSDKPDPLPFFYIDNGGVGLERILQPGIDRMLVQFKAKGMTEGEDFAWKLFPDARHNEAAWAARMSAALELIYKK